MIVKAIAGAAATISSDALMNPFDGSFYAFITVKKEITRSPSDQAAHADTQLRISLSFHLCAYGFSD